MSNEQCAMSTELLTRCRDFRNVWKKHGPSPLIPTAVELSEMEASVFCRSLRRRRLPAPTGLRPKAQGCRAAATLGIMATERPTPTGLSQGKRTRCHNPVGVVRLSACLPRVAPLRVATVGWRTQPRWGRGEAHSPNLNLRQARAPSGRRFLDSMAVP